MRLVGGMAKVALYIGLYMRFCILNTTRSCQLTQEEEELQQHPCWCSVQYPETVVWHLPL